MTRYKVTAPNARFTGEVATLVFRNGEADADTPADQAALDYCRRKGYRVVAVDSEGEPLADAEQPGPDTPDPDAIAVPDDSVEGERTQLERPADYASKGDWVAYAVDRGASEDDANAATKNELIELYG